jgi:hypothetical protein
MGYSTYRSAGSLQQVAALNVEVDVNGTETAGGFTTLVFEPVYNTDQGAVVNDTWQTWDAYKGGDAVWWSSNPINSAPNRDTFVSWDTIVDANPDAVIVGGFGVNQGSGNPGLVTSVDALKFNDTTYDFDIFQPTGEITSPAAGEHVRGTVTLGATYNDGDNANDDIVQWALRSSCNDNTTTVAGNVDGFNTPYTWDGATFGATVDTSTLTAGDYCFVFNPKDDAGQNDVRLTRTFTVDANAPYNKDECKNDGWKDFTAPAFKNQGDCVSFIASAGKAKGNPTPVMANNPKF